MFCGAVIERIDHEKAGSNLRELLSVSYGLACKEHHAEVFRAARSRRKDHPPSEEEAQGEIGVFQFQAGTSAAPLTQVANPA